MKEGKIILPDGRRLAYAVYGLPGGWPVLYFHGTPSSRLEVKLLEAFDLDVEQSFNEAGLELIAIDRPGMGRSSFNPSGDFLTMAADCYALIRFLGINSCSLLSWSGGGPFALALAAQHPSFVKDLYHICTLSKPFSGRMLLQMTRNKWYFLAAKYTPGLLRLCMNIIRKTTLRHSPPKWTTGLSNADYRLIKDLKHLNAVATFTLKEACRVNANGAVHEARQYFKGFGFSLSDIPQPLHFWWGEEDRVVVRTNAETVEQQVRNNNMHYKTGEGHLSIYIHCFNEVLKTIASANR